MNDEKKFYYMGKYFDTFLEFRDYVKEFSGRQTTKDDFNKLFEMIKHEIWINISIAKITLTNNQMRAIIEDISEIVCEKVWGEKLLENDEDLYWAKRAAEAEERWEKSGKKTISIEELCKKLDIELNE